MATESKPPITCHVLDTTLGKPAAGIPVVLTLHGSTGEGAQAQEEVKFSGTTNGDVCSQLNSLSSNPRPPSPED